MSLAGETEIMAKKVLTTIKLQAPGGQASPAPPVGPALGQHGINIMEFVKAFNAQTANDMGTTTWRTARRWFSDCARCSRFCLTLFSCPE